MSKPATDGDVTYVGLLILLLIILYAIADMRDHNRTQARLEAICSAIPECVSEP